MCKVTVNQTDILQYKFSVEGGSLFLHIIYYIVTIVPTDVQCLSACALMGIVHMRHK